MANTILDVYGTQSVTTRLIPESYYTESSNAMPLPDTYFGLELEIEDFANKEYTRDVRFRYDVDGSLRNHGLELISHPTKAKHIENMLTELYKKHNVTEANFSERCSTHVHMNVQDWTWDNVKTLCMLYLMFERLLFSLIGNDRKDNIFCVPWYESGVTPAFIDKMKNNPDGSVRQWVKYTALNLLPMRSYGTVEFRHLHGTCNVSLIMLWIRLISRMAAYSLKTDVKTLTKTVLDMNTVSNYDQFMSDVFAEDRGSLMIGDYQGELSVGVVDAKLMLMKAPKKLSFEEIVRGLDDIVNPAWGFTAPAQANTLGAQAPAQARAQATIPELINTTEGRMSREHMNQVNAARTRLMDIHRDIRTLIHEEAF